MKSKPILIIIALFMAMMCNAQQPFTNRFQFYIHSQLATPQAGANLAKLVADMNYILAKNTQHQIAFDPNNDVFVQNFPPWNGMTSLNPPHSNYTFRVYVQYSDLGFSWGDGGIWADQSGDGTIHYLNWHQIMDPDNLQTYFDVQDYRTQLIGMLHGYVLNYTGNSFLDVAGSMGFITDDTGVAPLKDIKMIVQPNFQWNYNDVYWGLHSDWYGDPFAGAFETTTRQEVLDVHDFSALMSIIIRRNYREPYHTPPFADRTNLTLKFIDVRTCRPLEGVRVRIWRMAQNNPSGATFPTALLVDQVTGTNGLIQWSWQSATPNTYGDTVRMIKCTRVGFPTNVFVLTPIDLWESTVFWGQDKMTNEVLMVRPKLSLSVRRSDKRVTVTNCVPGKTFTLEATTNLNSAWTVITNFTPTSTANFNYTPPANGPKTRFYRVSEVAECPVFDPPQQMMMAAPTAPNPLSAQQRRALLKSASRVPLPPNPADWIRSR